MLKLHCVSKYCMCVKLKMLKVQENLCDVCILFYNVVYANFGKHQIIHSILTRIIIFTKYNNKN